MYFEKISEKIFYTKIFFWCAKYLFGPYNTISLIFSTRKELDSFFLDGSRAKGYRAGRGSGLIPCAQDPAHNALTSTSKHAAKRAQRKRKKSSLGGAPK